MSMWVPGRFVACVLGVVLVVSGSAHARTPSTSGDPAAMLRAALRAKDVTGVVKLLHDPVHHRGIWFADEACANQFGAPRRISGADLVAFAQCLVQLELQETSRRIDARDYAMLTYEPGIELDVAFEHGLVTELGFAYDAAWRHGPLLTVQAFEALRRPGSPNIDAAVSERLGWRLGELPVVPMRAWAMVCIDGTGALTAAMPVKRYAPYEHAVAVSNALADAVGRTWKFRPFELYGKATPACALMVLSSPTASGSPVEPLPAPPLPAPGVETPPPELPPEALAGLRTSGESVIQPDDVTSTQMRRAGSGLVTSSFRLCLDASGAVARIVMLESSGFPRYDDKVQRQMHQWRFEPYRVRGKPVATCASFVFRYDPPPERQSPGSP